MGRPVDDALDEQIEMLRHMIRSSRPHSGSEEAHDAWDDAIDKAYAVLDTVREALERLREERDAAEKYRQGEKRRREAAEAEVRQLREERDTTTPLHALREKNRELRASLEAAEAEVRQLREERDAAKRELREFEHVDGEPLYETAAVAASSFVFARHRAEAAEAEVQRLKQENDELAEQAYQDRSKAQRLTEGLREYGHHKQGCNQFKSPGLGRSPEFSGQECDCGLAALLSASPSDGGGERMLVSVNHPSNPTDIVGRSAICPDCGNALIIATVTPDGGGAK